jgi:transposase
MNDLETQQQFVFLRSQGRSFARIAEELKVSKPTLIKWSRKFQFEIQNLRAIELEALKEKWLATREARVNALGEQLHKIEQEIAKRDIATVPTSRLYSLADCLRRQIERETGQVCFTSPLSEIPNDEYHEQVQDWTA